MKTYLFKKKYSVLIIVCLAVVLSVILFSMEKDDSADVEDDILLTVNGEELMMSTLEDVSMNYPDKSETQLIDGLILESLVLQKVDEFKIQVSDEVVETKLSDLKANHKNLYDLAIEQYHSEALYKVALKYRLEYEKIKERMVNEASIGIMFDKEVISRDAEKYIKEQGYEDITHDEMHAIEEAIVHNYKNVYAEVYFQKMEL